MPLQLTDVLALKRKDVLRLIKLVANIQEMSIGELTRKVTSDTSDIPIDNLSRHAIPNGLREKLWEEFRALNNAAKLAISEVLAPTRDFQMEETARSKTTDWQLSLKSAVPGFNLSHFDQQQFEDFPEWPEMHFLLLRHLDEDKVRIAHMTIMRHPILDGLPLFKTSRKNDFGQNKTVQGVVLKSGSELYTLGQLDGLAGLRFARLKMIPTLAEGEKRINLYGLRLGLKANTRRPFAHVVFGQQISKKDKSAIMEDWLKKPGGAFSVKDELLNKYVDKFDRVRNYLRSEADDAGLQPQAFD